MKLSNIILIVILLVAAWFIAKPFIFLSPQAVAMKVMVEEFPRENHWSDNLDIVKEVTYQVHKPDSPGKPFVGELDYTLAYGLNMQMLFHWENGHWKFSRLINRLNGVDYTKVEVGFLGGQEMRIFLAKYGYSAPQTPVPVAGAPVATPRSPYARPRTPTPQEISAALARKYGTH
jgi:hypothetical protein